MEAVRMSKHNVGRKNTYPGTSVNPEQNKYHPGGHTVHVIDLQIGGQVNCDNRNEVKSEPSHS